MTTTVNVTIDVAEADGSKVSGAKVHAELTNPDVASEYVVPRQYTGETDSNGQLVMALWPNALGATESRYHFKIFHPTTGRKVLDTYATIPNIDCNLADVAELPPYPGKPEGAIQAATAAASAGYSQEWANKGEDELISTAAGGDGGDDYSALHHAAKASAARAGAETAESNADNSASAAALSASNAAGSEAAAQTAKTGAETALAEIEQRAGDYVTAGGSANALTATPSPAWTSYSAGAELKVKVAATNTGAATINVSGLGTKNIKFVTGNGTKADLIGGMLTAGHEVTLRFDGVDMVITSAWPNPNNSEPIEIDCSAGGTVTLSALQNAYGHYNLTGSPSADFNLVIDTRARRFTVNNATGKAATVKTSAGTGIAVQNGVVQELRCDGTNVVVTDFDPNKVSRWVMTTAAGTTGDSGYWSNIAIISAPASSYNDIAVTLSLASAYASAQVISKLRISIRQDLIGMSTTHSSATFFYIENGGQNQPLLSFDSVKLVAASAVNGTDIYVWVRKDCIYGRLSVVEEGIEAPTAYTITYNNTAAWQASEPTGAVEITSDWAGEWKTFVPIAAGDTTAGVGTYTTQIGRYRDWMGFREFFINITWSAHTGAGLLLIDGLSFLPAEVYSPVLIGYTTKIFTNHPSAMLVQPVDAIRIYDGSTAMSMPSSGSFMLSGRYKL